MTTPDAFFEPVDDRTFRATVQTTGPWDPGAQHAGPPAALLGGALAATIDGLPLARLAFEILRPVPVATLTVDTSVVRPGRRVSLVEGTLSDGDGPCLLARAWGIRRAEVGLAAPAPGAPLAGPDTGRSVDFFQVDTDVGWHTGMELRFLPGGAFGEPGPATVWGRPRVDLVAGRTWSPLERVLVLADAGNGASAGADHRRWMFINTELTVHLTRPPRGDWVALDAHSVYEPDGVGAAFSVLHDVEGPIGRAAQALFLGARPTP